MEKKVVIGGCRDYSDYVFFKSHLDEILKNEKKRLISSGHCSGVDLRGERYAEENGFKVERYLADWEKYGRSAGPRRNKQMAEVSDYVICFWDKKSRGTASMITFAKSLGKKVNVKIINL